MTRASSYQAEGVGGLPVDLAGLADGLVLTWDAATATWKPVAAPAGGGGGGPDLSGVWAFVEAAGAQTEAIARNATSGSAYDGMTCLVTPATPYRITSVSWDGVNTADTYTLLIDGVSQGDQVATASGQVLTWSGLSLVVPGPANFRVVGTANRTFGYQTDPGPSDQGHLIFDDWQQATGNMVPFSVTFHPMDLTDLAGVPAGAAGGWAGVWAAGTYGSGSVVSHDGFLWGTTASTAGEPGVSPDWDKLATADYAPVSYAATWDTDAFDGLIDQLGTLGGAEAYVNPHTRGSVTASQITDQDGTRTADKAFDKSLDDVTGCSHTTTGSGRWWQVDFGPNATVRLDHFAMQNRSGGGLNPGNWKLQGSNDGTAWTDLVVETSGNTANSAWQSYPVADNTEWRYVRVELQVSSYLIIGELELWGDYTFTP